MHKNDRYFDSKRLKANRTKSGIFIHIQGLKNVKQ